MNGFFADKPYPGRFIVIGKENDALLVIYGATGRSPSSLARAFIEQGDGVYMAAVDATVHIQGNPELLEYPAIRMFENGIVVANGNHIDLIEELPAIGADAILTSAFQGTITYEPDEYKTPRITGCVVESGDFDAALHIVRAKGDEPEPHYYHLILENDVGSYIATYSGEDVRPTLSFATEPLRFPMRFGSPEAAASAVYEMLAPDQGANDYRVGVVAIYKKRGEEPRVVIKNRFS